MTPRRPGSGFHVLPSFAQNSVKLLITQASNQQLAASTAPTSEDRLYNVQRSTDLILQVLAIINGAVGVPMPSPPVGADRSTFNVDALADAWEARQSLN